MSCLDTLFHVERCQTARDIDNLKAAFCVTPFQHRNWLISEAKDQCLSHDYTHFLNPQTGQCEALARIHMKWQRDARSLLFARTVIYTNLKKKKKTVKLF